MIGGIIITHGDFASGIKHALEMIAGVQQKIETVSLHEGDGLQDLVQQILHTKEEMQVTEVFLFVDLFGATPCNASSLVCAQTNDPVIAGVNLPILLEFVLKRGNKNKEELLKDIEQCAGVDFRILQQRDLL